MYDIEEDLVAEFGQLAVAKAVAKGESEEQAKEAWLQRPSEEELLKSLDRAEVRKREKEDFVDIRSIPVSQRPKLQPKSRKGFVSRSDPLQSEESNIHTTAPAEASEESDELPTIQKQPAEAEIMEDMPVSDATLEISSNTPEISSETPKILSDAPNISSDSPEIEEKESGGKADDGQSKDADL